MDPHARQTLVHARDELQQNGAQAMSFFVVTIGSLLANAGNAIDAVLTLHAEGALVFDGEMRRAAHHAMGRLEALAAYSESFRYAEAYQVLLGIAYA